MSVKDSQKLGFPQQIIGKVKLNIDKVDNEASSGRGGKKRGWGRRNERRWITWLEMAQYDESYA